MTLTTTQRLERAQANLKLALYDLEAVGYTENFPVHRKMTESLKIIQLDIFICNKNTQQLREAIKS